MNNVSSSGFARGCVFNTFMGFIVLVALGLWFAFGSRILAERWSVNGEHVVAISSDGTLMAVAAQPFERRQFGHERVTSWSKVETRSIDSQKSVDSLQVFDVQSALFSHNNLLLVTASGDGLIRLWQLRSNTPLQTFLVSQSTNTKYYNISGWKVTFSTDEQFLLGQEGRSTAHVWRVADGALLRSFPARYAALHPSGKIIATSDATTDAITLWRVADGQQLRVFTPANRPRALTFSPDGAWLAAGSVESTASTAGTSQTGYVEVWQLASLSPQPAYTFTVRGIAIDALAWSADSSMLAAAGGPIGSSSVLPTLDFWPFTPPHQIHLWRIRDGAHLQTLYGPALQLQFSADGQQLYAVNEDTLYRWRIIPWARWLRWGLIGLATLGLAVLLWRWRRRRMSIEH